MADQKPISMPQAIEQELAQADGPISVHEFAQRVLTMFPVVLNNGEG
jgi:hypothetical protein